MFGKNDLIKKECHTKLDLVSMYVRSTQLKKAAMFGLDARIALAIFGALSVITGAALYSAIKQAKVVATVHELEEVGKAIEAYMLDTGTDFVSAGTSFKYNDLLEAPTGVKGWNGPYINVSGTLSNNKVFLDRAEYGNLLLRNLESNLRGVNYSHPNPCSTAPCYYWIQLNGIPTEMTKAIDEYVDGSASVDSGKIRILDTDNYNGVYLQGPPMLSQP